MVVAIIGILLAIGLPSYQNSVTRANRADVQATLLNFAQAMERHFNQNYSYEAAASGGADTGAPLPSVFPSQSPLDGGNPMYNLTVFAADRTSFTVQATPISGGRQDGDGLLTLDSLGQRGWDKNSDGTVGSSELTWER